MLLFVSIIPNASRNEIVGWVGEALKIKIAAPPVEGKANKELIHFLAKIFDLRPADLRIVSGETSRKKKIEILDLKNPIKAVEWFQHL